MVEKAWETIDKAMPDELFDQGRRRRLHVERVVNALAEIEKVTGRPAVLKEWCSPFQTPEEIPTPAVEGVANMLEKEAAALREMGPGAAHGVTVADKLAIYGAALDRIKKKAKGREGLPVTWDAFENMVALHAAAVARQRK